MFSSQMLISGPIASMLFRDADSELDFGWRNVVRAPVRSRASPGAGFNVLASPRVSDSELMFSRCALFTFGCALWLQADCLCILC